MISIIFCIRAGERGEIHSHYVLVFSVTHHMQLCAIKTLGEMGLRSASGNFFKIKDNTILLKIKNVDPHFFRSI
jgi:hypothetical protein